MWILISFCSDGGMEIICKDYNMCVHINLETMKIHQYQKKCQQ